MRKTRTVLTSLAAGGLLIGTAVLTAPVAMAATQVTCAQAQIDLANANAAEQGPAATLAVAKSADNSAHAKLAAAVTADATEDAVTTDPGPLSDSQDVALASAQNGVSAADSTLTSAQAAEAITARALARAEREVNTCGSIPTPTPTPAPVTVTVTPPPPPAATTPVYQIVNGQRCQLINGQWVPVAPAAVVPAPSCGPCTAPATQTVVEQIPTVTVPPAQAFTTQVAPSIPMTSAGDGSLRIDPTPVVPVEPGVITVTLDLGGILQVIQLPSLPVIPVLPAL